MSTNHFPAFAKLVADSFQNLAKSTEVFVTTQDSDALWRRYLESFPEGTDPKFKERTEHDCSCCKQFVRRAGNIVTLDDKGELHTVWDEAAKRAPYPYDVVARHMRTAIVAAPVSDLFRVNKKEGAFGAEVTRSLDAKSGQALTWSHFYTGAIPKRLQVESPGEVLGAYRTTVQVFERGLTELKADALETVVDLIEANSLYRGEEHKASVLAFRKEHQLFSKITDERAKNTFLWFYAGSPAARFRNNAIGTLVQDLSEGKEVEDAVKSFESKVAPQNYKRTSAPISPAMIKKAMATIEALGLEPALERRLAVMGDISVNDVLWVDGAAKPLMKGGGLASVLMEHAASTNPKDTKADEARAVEISMDAFVKTILPTTTSMEVLFKGELLSNLMALTAPVHPEPKQLFRWDNDFAWDYTGNATDSYLRKQVQSLGGRVDGVLRFSHMWNHDKRNASLMDLHVFMPGSTPHREGCHETYPSGPRIGWNQRSDRASGGVQDVDYVDAAPEGYVPVENITFPSLDKLRDGQYMFKIHNWRLRHPTLGGFRAEIEFGGKVFQYDHPEPLKHHEWVTLAVATLKNGVFTIEHKHPVGTSVQTKWGITTEQYVKVSAVTLSPNYWGDNASGNKHTFFVLDGAKCEESMRGIYNEYLHPRLAEHRKVFEVIGNKTKCQPTEGALAGVGFSSTKKDSVIVKVMQGKKQRIFRVQSGVKEKVADDAMSAPQLGGVA
jgi:hypothetical protein